MRIIKLCTIGGNLATLNNGSKALSMNYINYNPLDLPANTVRVRTNDGNAPEKYSGTYYYTSYETATLVAGTTDVYDVYKSGNSFDYLLYTSKNVVEVLGANTTGITSMQGMLAYCRYLTSVALFDTTSATNLTSMFYYCESLTSVPLFDTSNVTNISYMLADCHNLTSVPLFNTSKVTNIRNILQNCISLTSVPLFDTSNVTDMYYMLARCYLITSVPLFNTSKVTNMHSMLAHCTALTSIPLFDTSRVTDMSYMCYNCTNVQSGALALYQQASSQANPPTSYSLCFTDCGSNTVNGAAELAQIPADWK